MRKIIRILAAISLVATLSPLLGGCATFSEIGTGIALATKSIANPVTRSEEAQVELALDAAIQALSVYRQACIAGSADKNCLANIAAIQVYTRQIPPLIAQLRNFVDHNDRINASVVYNQLTTLYANVKGAASNLGINLRSLS
jgi:hypothetical protein